MNEEEKNAIEIVKGLAVYYDDYSLLDEEEIEENESVNKSIELILNLIEKLQKENEKLNKNYNSLIDKIILKIDEYDYKFEKAKKQNKNDIADYYWDLITNFKKLLGGE